VRYVQRLDYCATNQVRYFLYHHQAVFRSTFLLDW